MNNPSSLIQANLLCNSTGDLAWLVDRSSMWDTQDESKIISSIVDLNVNGNVLQSTTSLSTLNSNSSSGPTLLNATSTTMTPTPSLAIIPNIQSTSSQQQSQLSLSLPSSLLQSSTNLLQTSQMMNTNASNASTTTLASSNTQAMNSQGSNLASSLTSNELNARFDMWAECLAELFVYKNILKAPLTRVEAWRMVFFRLTQLFPYVDPK